MSNITQSLYNIRLLDELAEKKTVIHKIHPLAKVMTTGVYLIVTVSFGRYELSGLLPLIFYPIIVIALADIPVIIMAKRVLLVSPLIIGIGVFNPIINQDPMITLPWIVISSGWVSFLSLLVKGILTALAALLLISTTGITKIALALRMIWVPKIFILQFLLTYRYISVLIEEVGRILRAYSLRSPREKGIRFSNWGSLTGQLLIRTLDRAQRVYYSMCCRGFKGEYNVGREIGIQFKDFLYFSGWSVYFLIIRYFNISELIGSLMIGVGK